MDSHKDSVRLVIGYQPEDNAQSYTAYCVTRHLSDDTLEIIEAESRPGPIDRGELLRLCFETIQRHSPQSVSVRIGDGQPLAVSPQTVAEIISGAKRITDLMIGS